MSSRLRVLLFDSKGDESMNKYRDATTAFDWTKNSGSCTSDPPPSIGYIHDTAV